MTDGKARVAGIVFPLILVGLVAWTLLGARGTGDGPVWRAEFENVGTLVPGHEVRIRGTKVGSVSDVELTDRGTAMVTFTLIDGVEGPRADATASVRTADLFGDVYLALEPGHVRQPLRTVIAPGRTFVATRIQDVFDTFDSPTRTAVQTLVVELARSLEARGIDLNGAVLQLAPLLEEVDRIAQQLAAQDTQLDSLITSARGLTSQVAPRERDLDRLIVGLEETLATTATRGADIDRALRDLPDTLRRSRTTLARLQTTARTTEPLARGVGDLAPALTETAQKLGPFARQAEPALAELRPVIRLADATLQDGAQSLPRISRALGTARSVAPQVASLTRVLDPLVAYAVKGLTAGLGGLAAEPGDPAANGIGAGRNFFRGEAVLGCETFGMPTRPGCLLELLKSETRGSRSAARRSKRERDDGSSTPDEPPSAGNGSTPAPSTNPGGAAPAPSAGGGGAAPAIPATPADPPAAPAAPVDALLDFLLGP